MCLTNVKTVPDRRMVPSHALVDPQEKLEVPQGSDLFGPPWSVWACPIFSDSKEGII